MEKPTAPFIISIIGGIFILLGAIFLLLFYMSISVLAPTEHMVPSGSESMMYQVVPMFTYSATIGVLMSVVSGVAVIIGAVQLYSSPQQNQTWGIIILVFAVISLLGTGGFFIGALLGIIGGILALMWKPEKD